MPRVQWLFYSGEGRASKGNLHKNRGVGEGQNANSVAEELVVDGLDGAVGVVLVH